MCDPRPELLRLATWRAARYGLDGELIDVCGGESVPAEELVEQFLSYLRPALEDNGEWKEVCSLVERLIHRGTGASRQREAFQRAQRLEDVVEPGRGGDEVGRGLGREPGSTDPESLGVPQP